MADKVRDRLKDLAAFLENEHAVESVEESVEHLQRAVADCMTRSKALAQQTAVYLFQSHDPPSLLEFLDASGTMSEDIRKRDISHARMKVLDLLAEFIKTFGGHVAVTRAYIADTTQRCQTIARGDWSNKVRAIALEVVINVLKYTPTRLTVEDMDPSAYADKLVYDLKFGKATQTAKGTMLIVLGQLASVFPDQIAPKIPGLIPWIEDLLEKQFTATSPEMLLINGLLEALARLLPFEPDRYAQREHEPQRQKTFSYLHRILATTADGQLSRYQVTKAALRFLSFHAHSFMTEIGANAYTWYSLMKFCISSETKTVKEHAFAASNAVLETIGDYLAAEKDDNRKKQLNRLLKELLPVLADANAGASHVAFSLQCLSCLAPAILIFLGEAGFLKIEDRLHKFSDALLVLDEKATSMRWSVFSSFIQCLASFAEQPRSREFGDAYMSTLEAVVCHVLNAYPYCLWKSKVTLYKSLLLLVRATHKVNADELFSNQIVRHLLLLTVSNVTELQDMVILYHPETGNPETKLLYDFEDLWVALLRGKRYIKYKGKAAEETLKSKRQQDESYEDMAAARRKLLDMFLRNLLSIISGLDLSYQYDLQEARAASSSGGYKPNVPRDHSIMLNVTELIERLIPRLRAEDLRHWVEVVMITMFEKSRQLPLVSGFYRTTSVFAKVADSIKLLGGDDTAQSSTTANGLRSRYELFIRRIVHNMRFYKDELLVATSGCVLATPVSLLSEQDFAEAVIPALIVGRSFLPAAEGAVASLEVWHTQDSTRLEGIYDRVIPCLAAYLDQVDPEDEGSSSGTIGGVQVEDTEGSAWGRLLRRIMVLLGKCGGKAALIMSRDLASAATSEGRDFSSSLVKLSMTLGDAEVELVLDNLITHFGKLACESTDRKVKTAACELYHAISSYLCGLTATHPHTSGDKSVYHATWKKAFRVIVVLATDPEKICRSLFEPLLSQITRWFSDSSESYPHDYAALLDELIDGLSHETSTAIRDISGRCLSACLSAAIESKSSDLSAAMAKAAGVLRRLFSLCRHPGPAERTGAATAISYFLRTLREDDVMVVQEFGLACLKNFLFSLKLCGYDARIGNSDVQVLQDMTTKAIARLQRAVVRYPAAFSQKKEASASDGDQAEAEQDLTSFTEWVFVECASRESAYRTTCRQLFLAFSPIVGVSSNQWIQAYAQRHGNAHTVLAPLDQLAVSIQPEDRTSRSLQVCVDWLDQVTASLEFFTWVSEILGAHAVSALCSTTTTTVKRKSDDGDTAQIAGGQLTLSWAISQLFNHYDDIDQLQRTLPPSVSVNLHTGLQRASIRAVAELCDFWALSFKSDRGHAAEQLLQVDRSSRQEEMASVVIKCITNSHGMRVRNESETLNNLMRIKGFCQAGCGNSGSLSRALIYHADKYADEVCELLTSTTARGSIDHSSLKTVVMLFECRALTIDRIRAHAQRFEEFATGVLSASSLKPDSYTVAIEAMKIACCLGWNVDQLATDKSARDKLAPILLELLEFLGHELLWKKVSNVWIGSSDNSSTGNQRISLALQLLTQVIGSKQYPQRSSTLDAFAETLGRSLKPFFDEASQSATSVDNQRAQVVLELALTSLRVFSMCSKRVTSIVRSEQLVATVRKSTLKLLARRELSHFAKADCFSVLAALGATETEVETKSTLDALAAFVIDEFPIKSTDVKIGSRDYDIFRMLLGKLLYVVQESCSVTYLPAIYFALKEGDSHIFIEDVRVSLGKLVANLTRRDGRVPVVPTDKQLEFIVHLAEILLDASVDQQVRKALLDHLLIPMIELQNPMHLHDFFLAKTSHEGSLAVISRLATVVANAADVVSPSAFLTTAVAFALVEVLFRLVDPDQIRGPINDAFLGHKDGKGREFTMLVCKCASKFVTKTHDDLNDFARLACWKAYNCLLTAVSRTQKQEKFFDQILFQESLWLNIIDITHEYELRTETKPFERVPLSSFSATTLRQQLRLQRGGGSTQSSGGGRRKDTSSSLHFFTGSSLSQTSMTSTSSLQEVLSGEIAARELIYDGMEIELDAINDHPCMIPLLRVLKQMKADFGSGWEKNAMPGWMKKIFGVIADATSELNIRLFIVKIVLNAPDVFQPYSNQWADKLMDALLEATVAPSSGKTAEFHYLLRDCCTLLTEDWADADLTSSRTTASRFVNELIEIAPNDANFIMQDNLLLISKLVLQWKSFVRIDLEIVSKLLVSGDENPRVDAAQKYVALQVISAMLAADLTEDITTELFHSMDGSNKLQDGILRCLEHKRASIYNVAAEVCGLLLTHASSTPFRSKLVEAVTKFYNEEDFGRFLALLRSVSLHDANVLDSAMLHRLSFVLPRVVAIEAWSLSAVECLCNATKNATVAPELFTHCQSVLSRFLSHRNAFVQLQAVKLISSLVDHLDLGTLNKLAKAEADGGVGLFSHCSRQQDVTARQVYLSLAIALYGKELDDSAHNCARQHLLLSLGDEDSGIRKQALEFWQSSGGLAAGCGGRLVALFQSLFAAPVADVWLLYSTNLLLGMNAAAGDTYEAPLFRSGLGGGDFVDASIDAAWESKDQTMTPLFSVEADKFSAAAVMARASQNSGSLLSQGFAVGSSTQGDGVLASQSQLIASSLASQDSSSFAFGSLMSSQSDLSNPQNKRRRRFAVRSEPTNPQQPVGSNSSASQRSSFSKYAMKSDKNFFQERYALVKKNEEATRNRQRIARAQQVVMRRTYRVGDYPDIQIKLRDILDPLMALCEMHAGTSSLVLAGLVPAIVSSKTVAHDQAVLTELGQGIQASLLSAKSSLLFVSAVHAAYFSTIMKNADLITMIGIPFKVIAESGLASGSNLSAQLILEEYLNHHVLQSTDIAAECWDQLYKILAANQKSNLLVALSSQCCTAEESKEALQSQLAGDLPGAIASYRKAETTLEADLEMQPEDAMLSARFELHRNAWEKLACLERLNQWDKLQRDFVDPEDTRFDYVWEQESPYLEQGVGHFLRSQLGFLVSRDAESIEDDEEDQLRAFLKQAKPSQDQWAVLSNRFGVEVCLSLIALDDVGQARVLIEQLFPSILKRWTGTSRIARQTRLELLQNLSSAVQIDEALRITRTLDIAAQASTAKAQLGSFLNRWTSVVPSLGEGSMSAWSQFHLTQQVLSGFVVRVGKKEGALPQERLRQIDIDCSQLMLRYAGAAVHNDILALASKYLKDYRELCNAKQLPKVSVLMVDVFVSHVLKLAERQAQKTAPNGQGFTADTTAAITRYYQTSTKMFDNEDILELTEHLPLEDRVAIWSLEAKTFGAAAQFQMSAGVDGGSIEESFTRAFDIFRRTSRAIPKASSEQGKNSTSFTRCRTAFIEFLMDILFSPRATEWTALIDRKELVQALMENVVSGMARCDQECANYFPQLCELLPPYPDVVAECEQRVLSEVPIWTCLRWSSQLLALVQGPMRSTILKILEKMATEYPAALFYDFKLTSGDLLASGSHVDLSRLTRLLSNPVMEKFVDALRLIHHPELRLKEGLREVAKLLDDGKQTAAKDKVAHIWQDCFTTEHARLGGKIGHYNRDWARRAKRDVEKIMGRDGANLSAKTVLAAREWATNSFNVIPGKYGITKDMKARLADFAEWLDEFNHSKCRLELPGQYGTGWHKPDPASHVQVLSIHSSLGVLASKQLPKQITLHCSDQHNYTFLVKGGEDLRLDQRIEQLFEVMNQILSSDPRCRDRSLSTKTYKVIPMTAEIGMIEWLHGTSTLKGIIEKQLQQDPRCANLHSNKRAKLQLFNTIPAKQYETFLMKQRGGSFAAKVAAPSRQEVIGSFEAVQDLIPADLLRRQLFQLGSDMEDFILIRDEFASSLAVFSACSYILGIGDRHLDNFLLDHRTGRVIGIDFGVSFGAGASVLPVPELIPFRFTRQMESVLQPYDSANLLVQDMQAVFEALRDKKQVIESVMNVFLHEPLLDWQQSTTTHQREIFKDMSNTSQEATLPDDDVVMKEDTTQEEEDTNTQSRGRKRARKNESSTLSSSSTASSSASAKVSASPLATAMAWLPDVKIAIARRKLDGLSPRLLLNEELAQNPHLGKQLKNFQALVDTAIPSSASQHSGTTMSSLAQAQELVALARAPDLLGRTYHGWMPWL